MRCCCCSRLEATHVPAVVALKLCSFDSPTHVTAEPVVCPSPHIRPRPPAYYGQALKERTSRIRQVHILVRFQLGRGTLICNARFNLIYVVTLRLSRFKLSLYPHSNPFHLSRLHRSLLKQNASQSSAIPLVVASPPHLHFTTTRPGANQDTHNARLAPGRPFALAQHPHSVQLPPHSNLDFGGRREAPHG